MKSKILVENKNELSINVPNSVCKFLVGISSFGITGAISGAIAYGSGIWVGDTKEIAEEMAYIIGVPVGSVTSFLSTRPVCNRFLDRLTGSAIKSRICNKMCEASTTKGMEDIVGFSLPEKIGGVSFQYSTERLLKDVVNQCQGSISDESECLQRNPFFKKGQNK